jgi:hypothetical protein
LCFFRAADHVLNSPVLQSVEEQYGGKEGGDNALHNSWVDDKERINFEVSWTSEEQST